METNTETPQQQSTGAESFNAIVQSSKVALAEEEAKAQAKRPRGRPPGSKNTKGRENEIPDENPQKMNDDIPSHLPPIDLKPLAKDFTKIPFSLAAMKFKTPEIDLDDKEVETPAFYLDRLINLHLPDLEKKDPKKFTLAIWLLSIAVVGIKKFILTIDKKKKVQTAAPQQTQNQTENTHPANQEIILPEGLLPVDNFFHKKA